MVRFFRKYHKWVSLFFCFFILMFAFSGIVLNHRKALTGIEVGREWLPTSYHYENWNNGFAKGTLRWRGDSILLYGGSGLWLTTPAFSEFSDFNKGLRKGADNRKISNLISLPDGQLWCAGLYTLYYHTAEGWCEQPIPRNDERIADITHKGDTLVVLSRSHIYMSVTPYTDFNRTELREPEGYSNKISLFRTIWLLHSGELFGDIGIIVVDFIGILLIALSLTGILYTIVPYLIRYKKRRQLPVYLNVRLLTSSLRWHNRMGSWFIVLTLLLAVTGMCLRPPLMIPFVMSQTKPLPGSTLDSDNPWNDKLRSIRFDHRQNEWLLSTSAGFYRMADFQDVPSRVPGAPPVSPMGINVFKPFFDGYWLVGSFSGLFMWDPSTGTLVDYYTGQAPPPSRGRPVGLNSVSGYTADLSVGQVVFEYGKGATIPDADIMLPPMPRELADCGMSLWNFALELHVGRCYSPFLGPVSDLFVFFSGIFLTFILVSGYVVYRKRHNKK